MRKIIGTVAMGLLIACSPNKAVAPTASESPRVSIEEPTGQDAESILESVREKGESLMVDSKDNGYKDMLSLQKSFPDAWEVNTKAQEALGDDKEMVDLAAYAEKNPDWAVKLMPVKEGLRKALAKPKFHPVLSFDMDAPGIDVGGVYGVQKVLLTAGHLERKSDPDSALDSLLLCQELGNRLSGQGLVLTQMTATIIEKNATDALLDFLSLESLTKEQLQTLSIRLAAMRDTQKDFALALDFEFVMQDNILKQIATGKLNVEDISEEISSTNLDLEQEQKALDLVVSSDRAERAHLRPISGETQRKVEANPKVILGKMMPPYDKMYETARVAHSRFGGLRVLVALKQVEVEIKSPVKTLDELVPKYLKDLPVNCLREDGHYVYTLQGESFSLSDGAKNEPFQLCPRSK